MSNLSDLLPLLRAEASMRRAVVSGFGANGAVEVRVGCEAHGIECDVLQGGEAMMSLAQDDEVLVWRCGTGGRGVVLGRIGPYAQRRDDASIAAAAPTPTAALPDQLCLEARGDIVLRNARGYIRLSAQGDVEIVCENYAARCRRLLRLLAPLLHLN